MTSGPLDMPARVDAALDRGTVWWSVERATHDGRSCRAYHVHDDDGAILLSARAFPWRRDILVHATHSLLHEGLRPEREHEPLLVIRRRRSFPLTGRLDVFDANRVRIGTLNRTGTYRDARGRVAGAFRNARSLRDRATEGVLMATLDALLGGDGDSAEAAGPTAFVWMIDRTVVGTLSRRPLPFSDQKSEIANEGIADDGGLATSRVAAARNAARTRLSAIARGVRRALRSEPRGWCLHRTGTVAAGDHRLILAATLFAIELSHW